MAARIDIKFPALHERQLEVARSRARFKVLVCGRRWGKTRLALFDSLRRTFTGQNGWWVAPVYSIGDIAWRTARIMLDPAVKAGVCSFREGARQLVTPNGGMLEWKTADDPDKLRGEGLNFAVMDEADFMGEGIWMASVRPALGDKRGAALFCSTPNRENGWFHKMFQRGQEPEQHRIQSWHFPTWTNPFFDPEEVEDAQQDLPNITFRREFGAEFVSAEGARISRQLLQYRDPPSRQFVKIAIGVDLAISEKKTADFTALVVLARDRDGNLYVLEAVRGRWGLRETLKAIIQLAEKWQPEVVAVEEVSYQKVVINELHRTTNLPVFGFKPLKDKLDRFSPLEARYENGLVYHASYLSSAFEDELLSFPVGEHDDMVDALAYAYQAIGTLSATSGYRGSAVRGRAPAPRFR